MPTFQVTYLDSVLRQAIVQAEDAERAEELVREQMEDAEHHHAVDAWTDDWQVEPLAHQLHYTRPCFECGKTLR